MPLGEMTALLVVAVIAALILIAWLLVHRARHPYTHEDVAKARADSISGSRSSVSGKVQEHLAPLFPSFFSQFNSRDARFLGSPLDYIVFDGLDEGDVRRVVFVEVKTGKGRLSKRECLARDAIQAGNVEYQLLRLPAEVAIDAADAPSLKAQETPPALQP
jgi:predicted Holliday junction resolvase-like endonuclease